MMRLACVFALIAMLVLGLLVANLNGSTAIVFSFVGFPCLGVALLLYFIARWRAGALRFSTTAEEHPTSKPRA